MLRLNCGGEDGEVLKAKLGARWWGAVVCRSGHGLAAGLDH